ncbi:MAG TPA: exodeoxyribonuclease VII large subunit, partial [Candidatus Obscuribacter sp.]|nr:exodeoxyribonuclease VII large subunit [Candidatus Obscuribacter sp.]
EGRLDLSLANVQRNKQILTGSIDRLVAKQEHQFLKLRERLKDLGPGSVLSRGFSILRSLEGNVISEAGDLKAGDKVEAIFKVGRVKMTVDSVDRTKCYDQ